MRALSRETKLVEFVSALIFFESAGALAQEPRTVPDPDSLQLIATILVASSSAVALQTLGDALQRRGHAPLLADSTASALRMLHERMPELVVVALPLPGEGSRSLIARIQKTGANLIVSGTDGDVKGAVDALDLGAHEYLDDATTDTGEFLASVGVALGSRRGDVHLRYLRERDAAGADWQSMVGRSEAVQKVLRIIKHVCQRAPNGKSPTILLKGETGTGKGFMAKCVHYNSGRRSKAFVEFNCAALPPTLIEAELFGYERAAFTDTNAARPGLFETAAGGTLFLDEIAALPLDLQEKVLKALEERTVRRIGGCQALRVDVQIVAATHENLEEKSKDGTFRTDLYDRLKMVEVTLPPLRERADDIVLLAEAFIDSISREHGIVRRRLSEDAKRWMHEYPWPGNVRELRNQIERILLLENDPVIHGDHFHSANANGHTVSVASAGSEIKVDLPSAGVPLEALEREVLREALARCQGNVSRTARFLSISRQTLIYRMKKHGLSSLPRLRLERGA